jgi:hypothetical protein
MRLHHTVWIGIRDEELDSGSSMNLLSTFSANVYQDCCVLEKFLLQAGITTKG